MGTWQGVWAAVRCLDNQLSNIKQPTLATCCRVPYWKRRCETAVGLCLEVAGQCGNAPSKAPMLFEAVLACLQARPQGLPAAMMPCIVVQVETVI